MKIEGCDFTVEKKQHPDRKGGTFTHYRYRMKILSDPDALRKCFNIVLERIDERTGFYAIEAGTGLHLQGWQAVREASFDDERNGTGRIIGTAKTRKALIGLLEMKGVL